MRNSSAASGLHPGQNSKRGGNAITPDRIINIDVRGATRMFNYWESARAGAHLWLVWRELNLGESATRDGGTVMGHPPAKRPRENIVGTTVRYRIVAGGEVRTGRVISVDGVNYMVRPPDTHGAADVAVERRHVIDPDPERCWQLLPYSEGVTTDTQGEVIGANYKELRIWWSDQTVESRTFKRPICVGWVFQGLGRGELSDSSSAIRKATQLAESRFQLPMIHAFLHV